MGSNQSQIPPSSPLGFLISKLSKLGVKGDIKVKCLIFFCNTVWPQHKLDKGNHWPENGTFDHQILRDLDNFIYQNSKRQEVPSFTFAHVLPSARIVPHTSNSFLNLCCWHRGHSENSPPNTPLILFLSGRHPHTFLPVNPTLPRASSK